MTAKKKSPRPQWIRKAVLTALALGASYSGMEAHAQVASQPTYVFKCAKRFRVLATPARPARPGRPARPAQPEHYEQRIDSISLVEGQLASNTLRYRVTEHFPISGRTQGTRAQTYNLDFSFARSNDGSTPLFRMSGLGQNTNGNDYRVRRVTAEAPVSQVMARNGGIMTRLYGDTTLFCSLQAFSEAPASTSTAPQPQTQPEIVDGGIITDASVSSDASAPQEAPEAGQDAGHDAHAPQHHDGGMDAGQGGDDASAPSAEAGQDQDASHDAGVQPSEDASHDASVDAALSEEERQAVLRERELELELQRRLEGEARADGGSPESHDASAPSSDASEQSDASAPEASTQDAPVGEADGSPAPVRSEDMDGGTPSGK